jgi:hypothetical protein
MFQRNFHRMQCLNLKIPLNPWEKFILSQSRTEGCDLDAVVVRGKWLFHKVFIRIDLA